MPTDTTIPPLTSAEIEALADQIIPRQPKPLDAMTDAELLDWVGQVTDCYRRLHGTTDGSDGRGGGG